MAAQKGARVADKKRSKKRKSRTEVSSSESSSSSSESEVEHKKSRRSPSSEESTVRRTAHLPNPNDFDSSQVANSTPEPTAPRAKKESKAAAQKKAADDVPMRDASSSPEPAPVAAAKPKVAPGKEDAEFDAIYIRKITGELADDLDKVREAQDFKANSIPMLIHALKQGESLFSGAEKRRVVGAAKV